MLRKLISSLLLAALAGCAGVLPQVERTSSKVLYGAPDAPLVMSAQSAGLAADTSGVWPLVQASFALDARLAMIRAATRSIDLQTYLIADDSTGRMLLRALRDAALRGVRVRVLLDDLTPPTRTRCCSAWPRTRTWNCACSTLSRARAILHSAGCLHWCTTSSG